MKKKQQSEAPFSVDAQGIPILDQVVESKPIDSEDSAFVEEDLTSNLPPHGLNLPRHDILLQALRNRLHSELQGDLEQLIERASTEAVEQAIHDMKPIIQERLRHLLEQRTNELLEQILNDELNPDQ